MQPALRILIIPNHKNGFPPKFLKDSKLQALAYFLSPRGFGWWVCLFFKKKPITTCFEMKALRSFLLSFIGRHICWSQCRSGSQYQSVWWFFPWLFSWLWSSTHNEKFPEAFNTTKVRGLRSESEANLLECIVLNWSQAVLANGSCVLCGERLLARRHSSGCLVGVRMSTPRKWWKTLPSVALCTLCLLYLLQRFLAPHCFKETCLAEWKKLQCPIQTSQNLSKTRWT